MKKIDRSNITLVSTSAKSIQRLTRGLFQDSSAQEQFISSLTTTLETTALLWLHDSPQRAAFETLPRTDFMPTFVDLVPSGSRPGLHPLHESGNFYCLDLSSVFAASPLISIFPQIESPTIVDVCASPGGKSLFASRALNPELLLCNEVIGKRVPALLSNLKRCRIQNAYFCSVDPAVLANRTPDSAEIVLVDAPCSGQSLLRKGQPAPGAFMKSTINANVGRQRRILAESSKLVAPGGYLLYMTCTFSLEENEENVKWFLKKFPQFTSCEVSGLEAYRSHLSDFPSFRLWPQQQLGAGAFSCLMRRENTGSAKILDLESIGARAVEL